MLEFCALFEAIDSTNRTQEKVGAVATYFKQAQKKDAAWALFFLTGNRLPAPVKTRQLRNWAGEISGYPEWMVSACYDRVGDLAETLALLLPAWEGEEAPPSLKELVETVVQPMRDVGEGEKRQLLTTTWKRLNPGQRFIFNKLITGGFRMGVQRTLVVRALAELTGVEAAVLEHRLMGKWKPTAGDFEQLCDPESQASDPEQPYPFYLAYPMEERSTPREGERTLVDLEARLGRCRNWQVEWKYDGIRAQLIRRKGQVLLWSRGEEVLTGRFPEITRTAAALPDGLVLDGELLAWRDGSPLPFSSLQKRIGRHHPSAHYLDRIPCLFMAYDCLEFAGADVRKKPLMERRELLERLFTEAKLPDRIEVIEGSGGRQIDFGEALLSGGGGGPEEKSEPTLQAAPVLEEETWEALSARRLEARERGVEGLMLKRKDSAYGVGRKKGDWWKWKCDPYTIDAVLIYAQAGHGRRAGLDTDFTFAVWEGDPGGELVPVCKAYSGLTDAEFRKINRWIQRHTLSRQGPVRMVEPEQVFEIAFEGINRSSRHKSGLAFRFPRMSRWREDKPVLEAETLERVRALLPEAEEDK